MKLFGKELVSSSELQKINRDAVENKQQYDFLLENLVSKQEDRGGNVDSFYEKAMPSPLDWATNLMNKEKAGIMTTQTGSMRPPIDTPFVSTDSGAKIPVNPFPIHFLYQLTRNVDALRIPIEVINRELFRNGFKVEPVFRKKCKACEKEFNEVPSQKTFSIEGAGNDLKCDACGGKNFHDPDPKQRKKLVTLTRKVQNDNGQRLKDILRMLEKDLEIADWGCLALLKTYRFKADGKIKDSRLDEIIRLHPPQCFMITDYEGRLGYDDRGNKVYVCPNPEHRAKRLNRMDAMSATNIEIPRCPEDGLVGIPAMLEVNSQYATNIPNPKRLIYAKGEIIFKAGKYWPDLVYGYSPIYSLWQKVMSLAHMDEYVRKYFDKFRPPKGLLVIATRNIASVQKMFDKIKVEGKRDPYNIHPLIVENEKGGRNMVQYVNLMGSLEDLKFIEIRDEFRRTIGAMYGVLPLFSGDIPSGWNQEGLEMTVTNRAVQDGQTFIQESFLDPLSRVLGVSDWKIVLKKSEEMDELREHQIRGMELANAEAMMRLGYKHELDGDGNFVFSQKPEEPEPMANDQQTQRRPGTQSSMPKGEQMTTNQGSPLGNRNSDPGGKNQGAPASGPNTSLSRKTKKKKAKVTKYRVKSIGTDEEEITKVETDDITE